MSQCQNHTASPFFSNKDPAEIINVSFDFANLTLLPSAPAIIASVAKGTDPNPSAILSGSLTVDGSFVVQKIIGGIDGVVYKLEVTANSPDGSRYVIPGYLPVVDA